MCVVAANFRHMSLSRKGGGKTLFALPSSTHICNTTLFHRFIHPHRFIPSASPPTNLQPQSKCLLSETIWYGAPTAWEKLAKEKGGDPKAFADHATFAFADFTLGATFDQQGSLDKVRDAGWTVVCDTVKDGYLETYRYLQEIGTLPKL